MWSIVNTCCIAEVWSPPLPKLWLVYIFSLLLAESRDEDERVSSFVTFLGLCIRHWIGRGWKLEFNSGNEKIKFFKVFLHILLFLKEEYFWRRCIFFFNENYHLKDSLQIKKYLKSVVPLPCSNRNFSWLLSLVERELFTFVCTEGHDICCFQRVCL